MLLLMCLAYLILTLPDRLCFSIFVNDIIGHEYTDTVFLATNTLMYTRCVLNVFFIYMSVVGFRRDVRNFLLRCFRRRPIEIFPRNNTMTRDGMHIIMTIRGKHPVTIVE